MITPVEITKPVCRVAYAHADVTAFMLPQKVYQKGDPILLEDQTWEVIAFSEKTQSVAAVSPNGERKTFFILTGEDSVEVAIKAQANHENFLEHYSEMLLADSFAALDRERSAVYSAFSKLLHAVDGSVDKEGGILKVRQAFSEVQAMLVGTSLEFKVIYSESENGFWSNVDGWGDLQAATRFTTAFFALPMSSLGDARVMPLSQATALEEERGEHGVES